MSEPLIAEISLKKLRNNALKVKSLLNKKVKFCAVVKSDAYGHGLVEISSELYRICDCFAVSLLSECEALRKSGIDKPIILLSPVTENTVQRLILNDITLSVSTFKELILIIKTAKKLNAKVKIHLAVNIGMNRLGFSKVESVNKAVEFIKKFKCLDLEGCYSHFGNVKDKIYTESCFKTFKKLSKPVTSYNKNAVLHVSASGGLLTDKKYQLSMVRVGLLIYGYSPIKTNKINVEPIMNVFARNLLNQKSVLEKRLMYGDKLSSVDDVSILRLGYADGFFRSNTEDFVSNLCMDLSAVKLASSRYVNVLKDANYYSEKLNTIPYEILVSITKRAIKKYY